MPCKTETFEGIPQAQSHVYATNFITELVAKLPQRHC